MPIEIEFEGVVHEFPDDFTDADIAAALGDRAAQPAPLPEGKSMGGFMKNIGTGLGDLVTSPVQMALHPVRTVRGMSAARDQQEAEQRAAMADVGGGIGTPREGVARIRQQAGQAVDVAYEDPVGLAAMIAAPYAGPPMARAAIKAPGAGLRLADDLVTGATNFASKHPSVPAVIAGTGALMAGGNVPTALLAMGGGVGLSKFGTKFLKTQRELARAASGGTKGAGKASTASAPTVGGSALAEEIAVRAAGQTGSISKRLRELARKPIVSEEEFLRELRLMQAAQRGAKKVGTSYAYGGKRQ